MRAPEIRRIDATQPMIDMRQSLMIEVKQLRRNYGSVVAVKDVSFTVNRGEVVGFLGPNGAGKSTTLRMIVGYLGPSAGYVRVNGFDVVEQPMRARQAIGYMPETAPLYPEMRVREYLTFRARLKQLQSRQIEQLTRALENQLDTVKRGRFEQRSQQINRVFDEYRQWVHDTLTTEPQPWIQVLAGVCHPSAIKAA